jgi:soluble lytic murein transglycosylase-like protein
VRDWFNRVLRPSPLAPLFTHEIAYWGQDIRRWAETYGVEPNLLATIMQIESCGHPTIASHAGAQGLFQVMPFHFEAGEDPLDPDTNARRGALFLKFCMDYTGGDVGLTLACYNGGPATTRNPNWSSETRRYYHWGTGIYADALVGKSRSDTLDAWLKAGGSGLCALAARELGL